MKFLLFQHYGIVGTNLRTDSAAVACIRDRHGCAGQHVIGNGVLRTVCGANSAFDTLVRVDEGKVAVNFNGLYRTNLFTDAAARTADLTNLPDPASGIRGITSDANLVADRFQDKDIPRAGHDTFITGCAFVRINNGKAVRSHDDGIEGADCLTSPVPHAGIPAGLTASTYEDSRAAIVNPFVLGFHCGLFDGPPAFEYGDLFDHIPDLKTQEFGKLRYDNLTTGGAACRLGFTLKETHGETGTASVSAGPAVQAGQDPLDGFQTGVHVYVEFLRCHTEAESSNKAQPRETDNCSNHSSISPFRKSP